jgi:hypothetical protein
MELLIELREDNKPEEPSEECTPKPAEEENVDLYEYDYNKRLWF